MSSAAPNASRIRTSRSERAAAGGVVIACGDPNRPGSIPSQMDWALLVVSLLVILAGAELFTNGVEWVGEGFGLSEGAVGSVLAAVGTALPETLLPIIAIASGHAAGEDIGVGADPRRAVHADDARDGGRRGRGVHLRARGTPAARARASTTRVIRQDLGYFLVMYSLAVVAGLLHSKPFDYALVIVLMVGYVYYVRRHFQGDGEEEREASEEIRALYVWDWLRKLRSSLPHGRRTARPAAPFVQVALALGLIVLGARDVRRRGRRHRRRPPGSRRSRSRCWSRRSRPSCPRSSTACSGCGGERTPSRWGT